MRAAYPQPTAAVQPAPVMLPPSGDDPLAALRAEVDARSGRAPAVATPPGIREAAPPAAPGDDPLAALRAEINAQSGRKL